MPNRKGAFCVHLRRLDKNFRLPSRDAVADMTTSKVPVCDEHSSERRSHGHHSIDHLNPPLDRRASGLAPQPGLGLLAEWRSRTDSFDLNNSRFNGTPVKGGAFGLTRPRNNSGRRLFRDLVCPEAVE